MVRPSFDHGQYSRASGTEVQVGGGRWPLLRGGCPKNGNTLKFWLAAESMLALLKHHSKC